MSKTDKSCFHCGESCENECIEFNSHQFCCNGCKTVYEILNQNDLCGYYNLENQPGISLKLPTKKDKFDYLESEEICNQLLDFKDEKLSKITLFIPSIHCSSCIWLLENLYKLQNSIVVSRVNFVKKEVYITFKNDITLRNVVELISSLGYEPKITLNDTQKKEDDSYKKLLYKIGVAGFFGGNIMMISFPEYFGDKTFFGSEFQHFFGYINFGLSLPILLYSSSDYFKSAFLALKNKNSNIDVPVSLGILVIFIRSSYEIFTQTGAGYMDSMAGLVFFLLVGKWFQSKTYQALSYDRDYKSYFPVAATVIEDKRKIQKPIDKLKKGDIVRIKNSEIIPADAILISNMANIDYSFVTGESQPIEKHKNDSLYAGGKQVGASIDIKIEKKVSQSYLTQLWNQQVFKKKENNKQLASIIDKISRYFTFAIICIALFSGFIWYFIDASQIINVVTAVLIIACPCALALTLPFAYGNALRIFSKQDFYLKSADIVEKLSKIDTIVFDKTGTLTQGNSKKINFFGDDLTTEEQKWIKSLTAHSAHPLSIAIYDFLNVEEVNIDSFNEIENKGIEGKVKGNILKLGSSDFTQAESINENHSRVYVRINDKLKGYFAIENQYREGLKELISKLLPQYDLYLLSGDNVSSKATMEKLFPSQHIFFNQTPLQKLSFIEKLQKEGKKVMMIGDGLNDSGALKTADVGVAITDDIYNFTPSSDAILGAEKFTQLAKLLKFSHTVQKIVKASFALSFAYNLIGLSFAVQNLLSPLFAAVLMPLSSISVVVFITISIRYISIKPALFMQKRSELYE